jgi:hypothetical protein
MKRKIDNKSDNKFDIYEEKLKKLCCENCGMHVDKIFEEINDYLIFEDINSYLQKYNKMTDKYERIKKNSDENGLPKDYKYCGIILNNIIKSYGYFFTKSTIWDNCGKSYLLDINNASRILSDSYNPVPHKFAELFFDNGFNKVELINIYSVVDSADPILFKIIIDKGYNLALHSDLLNYLINRLIEKCQIRGTCQEVTGSGFGFETEHFGILFDEMFVQICKIMFLEANSKKFKYECSKKNKENIKKNKNLYKLIMTNKKYVKYGNE